MKEYLEDLKAGGRPMTNKELADHYKHLYSEVKKQKDELETSYDILQKNNITLVKQKEEAYKIADDYYKENQQLKHNRDKAIELINDLDIECNDDYDFYIMSSGVYCNPKIELLNILKGDRDE